MCPSQSFLKHFLLIIHHLISGITISLAIQSRELLSSSLFIHASVFPSCHPPMNPYSEQFLTCFISCVDYHHSLQPYFSAFILAGAILAAEHSKPIINKSKLLCLLEMEKGTPVTSIRALSAIQGWRQEEGKLGSELRVCWGLHLELQTYFLSRETKILATPQGISFWNGGASLGLSGLWYMPVWLLCQTKGWNQK